jgi:hypothetical protein
MLTELCEAVETGLLVLRDSDLVDQIATYKNDKVIERTARSETLGGRTGGRRDRHHWDKVSALLMACRGARSLPNRYRARVPAPGRGTTDAVLFPGLTWADVDRIRAEQERAKHRSAGAWRERHRAVYNKPGHVRRRARR